MSKDKRCCGNCKHQTGEDNLTCAAKERCNNNSAWRRDPTLWLSILPAESGWYWFLEHGAINGDEVVIYIGPESDGKLRAYGWGTDYNETLLETLYGEFQGPITPKGK